MSRKIRRFVFEYAEKDLEMCKSSDVEKLESERDELQEENNALSVSIRKVADENDELRQKLEEAVKGLETALEMWNACEKHAAENWESMDFMTLFDKIDVEDILKSIKEEGK